MEQRPHRSKTVHQAVHLLESLAEHGPGSAADLAARLQINRTVVYRLLNTFEDHGFVRRDHRVFGLGPALFGIANQVVPQLRDLLHHFLVDLSDRVGETAVLSVPDRDDVVAIDQVLAEQHALRVQFRPSFRHSQARGALGRAILAFQDDAVVQRVLDRSVADTAEADRIRERLEQTRATGYSLSHDELHLGAMAIAAPVRDAAGRAVAAMGTVAPVSRLLDEATIAPVVLAAAGAASAEVGSTPPQADLAAASPR